MNNRFETETDSTGGRQQHANPMRGRCDPLSQLSHDTQLRLSTTILFGGSNRPLLQASLGH
eukprot:scaffold4939_cov121-Isochrysis_galbana.AAC.8